LYAGGGGGNGDRARICRYYNENDLIYDIPCPSIGGDGGGGNGEYRDVLYTNGGNNTLYNKIIYSTPGSSNTGGGGGGRYTGPNETLSFGGSGTAIIRWGK
jgi:hypothetical protein